MISDAQVEAAVDFLRDNATRAGELRGERIHAEEYRKHLKAVLMKHSGVEAIGAQEREAYAHEKYEAHLEKLRKVVVLDETNRALREAAALKIAVWQTTSANQRGKL